MKTLPNECLLVKWSVINCLYGETVESIKILEQSRYTVFEKDKFCDLFSKRMTFLAKTRRKKTFKHFKREGN